MKKNNTTKPQQGIIDAYRPLFDNLEFFCTLFLFKSGWCNRIVWAVRRYMPER